MAQEIRSFTCTLNPGTTPAAPQIIDMATGPRVLRRVEVKIPPGPRGNVGFQLGMARTQLIPYNAGAFVVSDDEEIGWDLEGVPTSGAWQLIGYNAGQFSHTLYVRMLLDLPSQPQDLVPGLLSAAALEGGAALSQDQAEAVQLSPPSAV